MEPLPSAVRDSITMKVLTGRDHSSLTEEHLRSGNSRTSNLFVHL